MQRWFLEGEVTCFRDPGHIALGLIAILVLVVLILLIPTVFVFSIIGQSPRLRVLYIVSLCTTMSMSLTFQILLPLPSFLQPH